ncbi:MAG TPA: chitobiase/beta-hexosaminidase C-terminal domain-containing protein [Opitutaceae bacterium]
MFRVNRTFARVLGWALLTTLISAVSVSGATYYVDPATGSMSNNGSVTAPWSTLEAVFKAGKKFQPGDVINLRSGYHGYPTVTGNNTGNVTIQAQSGHTPKLRKLVVNAASRWVISGLTISPEVVGSYEKGDFVALESNSSHITVEACTVYSAASIANWTAATWPERAGNGIRVGGPNCVIADNHIKNTRYGLQVWRSATGTVVSGNTIENFMGDGIRGLGNYCVYEYNIVKNSFRIDDHHDDGFQCWSTGSDGQVGTGVVRGVVLRGNMFISFTDPNQPEKGTMQGIGCFDGMFEDWVVENNLVVSDVWHGIAFYGAKNCRFVNNTVVANPITSAFTAIPWLGIFAHKNGTASSGNLVRNNLASTFKLNGSATVDSNITSPTSAYTSHFVNYSSLDFHLKATSPAVNAGNPLSAPSIDLDEKPRTSPPDAGCYELVTTSSIATVATPTFGLAAGTYSTAQLVAISSATSGASIRYTIDGSTPTASAGILYAGPVPVSATTTLKAVAFKSGMTTSAVASATYTINASATLISEAFASSAGSFVVNGGTWSVSSGKYVLSNPVAGSPGSGNGNLAIHGTSVSGNFVLTVDGAAAATTSAWDDFSVIFGYQDASNYYYVSFNERNDGLTSGVFKVSGGVSKQLADITAAISGGRAYSVKIEKSGSTYKVYRSTTLLATATDSTFAGGRIGLGAQNNGASFDNLTVVSAP